MRQSPRSFFSDVTWRPLPRKPDPSYFREAALGKDRHYTARLTQRVLYKLYDLTRDELGYILGSTDVYGDDFPSETFRVLKKNEMREFGEYRTRRLVLEAWDRLFATEQV